MKTLIFLIVLSWSMAHANILIIGDSHTAGPFGSYLHKNLTKKLPQNILITLGHSSSAPMHWLLDKNYFLSGGVGHHLSVKGAYYPEPNPTHWRVKRKVPKLKSLLDNPIPHPNWQAHLQQVPVQLDTVVIALGANDRNTIANRDGTATNAYSARQHMITQMLDEVDRHGLKCIWIAPPHSTQRPLIVGDTTYKYIAEVVDGRCSIYDSRKFVARYCDQIHFNCPQALATARTWAQEVADFIIGNL